MKKPYSLPQRKTMVACLTGALMLLLSGCASVDIEHSVAHINDEAHRFTQGQLALARTPQEHEQRAQAVAQLLATPLGQSEAVRLALLNSAALQALLAQGWAQAADAAQSGRIANPVFSFERIVAGDELELGRALSFGLLDVLTLPARQGIAQRRLEQAQVSLTGEVVEQVTRVRQAWVRAVAAQQTMAYAQQVLESAQASAELARRMQSAGNFNRISRAREQSFYADAATRLAVAQHQMTASREELVRLLGLDTAQAVALKLPQRLPDLPKQVMQPQAVASVATHSRLDIRLAQLNLAAAQRAQGLNHITSFTDIELTLRRDTVFDNSHGTRSNPKGYEIDVRLPIFDWGGMQRDAWNARTLAAANTLEATVRSASSHVRESYSAYRTTYDIAQHYRTEVVPVRKVISEENQLRYNAMLIGVFELLADARDQVSVVMAALEAEQQFWLADAALQAALIGRPVGGMVASSAAIGPATSVSTSTAAGH